MEDSREKEIAQKGYDKTDIAKKIVKNLEGVTKHDWEQIRKLIDSRYDDITSQSDFTADEITLKRISNWSNSSVLW